jgi:hypothetical protein
VAPPLYGTVACQLRGNLKGISRWPYAVAGETAEELCLLPGTDVRAPVYATSEWPYWPWRVEVPAGSSRYYFILGVVDQARGFMNEYRSAVIVQTTYYEGAAFNYLAHWPYAPAWPTPYP